LRSDFIKTQFDETKIRGFWYEIAYEDIAQLGESCQWYNKTSSASNDGILEKFGFTYIRPSHIDLIYKYTNDIAVYEKSLTLELRNKLDRQLQFSSFNSDGFGFPTVIVDATLNQDGTSYETLIEYLCFEVGPVTYEEIRLGARTPTVSKEVLDRMIQTLANAGLSTNSLTYVNHNNCEYDI
jgi:hypothetical protein